MTLNSERADPNNPFASPGLPGFIPPMPRKFSEILEEARQLPYGERAELIEQLIADSAKNLDSKVEGDEALGRLKKIEQDKVKPAKMANTVTAICAVLIALASLYVSISESKRSRRHDRISVSPHLSVTRDFRNNSEHLGIVVQNAGLGPAILEQVILSVDGVDYDLGTIASSGAVFDKLWKPDDNRLEYQVFKKGFYCLPNTQEFLFQVRAASLDAEELKRFQVLVLHSKVKIIYSSLYGDRFTTDPDASSPIVRH